MTVTRLDSARYRRTPWKNGGGVTIDIAGEFAPAAAPGGWDGVIWRFGQTRIERPGPFSDLSGFDRLLAVVEGRGLVLRPEGAPALDVRQPFRPVRFPGEWPIESELEDGPVAVVNLMADRDKAAIDLCFASGLSRFSLAPGTIVLFAAAGAATLDLGAGAVALQPSDALRIESDEAVALTVREGVLAAASIRLHPRR